MTEDQREEMIRRLCDEFVQSVRNVSDEQRYSFIAGARSAAHEMDNRLNAAIRHEKSRLKAVNEQVAEEVRANLQILHSARVSALEDFLEN